MKNKKYLGMAAAALAFVMLAFQGDRVCTAEASGETISKGVYLGDVDVSGMTGEQAKEAVEAGMAEIKGTSITLKVEDASATVTAGEFGLSWKNKEIVEEALGLGKSGNLIKRYKDKKDLENETRRYPLEYSTDNAAIKKVVQEHADVFNREPTDAEISAENGGFDIVSGQNGIAVNTEKSVKKIAKFMKNKWDYKSATIELAADVKEPACTTEELENITDVLGSAVTYYGSSYSRNKNVETGAAKLNGHLLMPGESFSVTEAVTPFTEENGYEPAPSYESGKVVDSYGGGICQVSTTLYNAVLKAELEVLERHNHTMIVTYVEPSKDAAIAEGLMDFCFANNTEYPIFISGYAYGGEIGFTIYGHETRNPDRVVEYISETTGTTEPEGVKLYAKADQPVGYLAQTQGAHQGLSAVLWKCVTENGETTREQINYSNYQAVPVSYDVGIATSDPAVAAAIQAAVASNDLEQVQAVLNGNLGKTDESESESETEKPEEPEGGIGMQPETPAPELPPEGGDTPPDAMLPEENVPQVIE